MLNGTGPLPGIVARDASQTNWFEVAQAKSPTVSAAKCQTSRPFAPVAVDFPGPRSAAVTILRVESDSRTWEKRSRAVGVRTRSEEHTSELQSPCNLVCRLLLEKKKKPHEPHRTA